MMCAVNSRALALAGVTGQTAVPAGGTIDKNPQTGEVTGIFRDTATNLVWQAVPEPTIDELSEATAIACQKIAEAGITSVHWIILSKNELQIIKRLHAEGKFITRVNVIVPQELLKENLGLSLTDNAMIHVGGAVIATDGYLDSKTAALTQPYSDEPSNSGSLLCTGQELGLPSRRY